MIAAGEFPRPNTVLVPKKFSHESGHWHPSRPPGVSEPIGTHVPPQYCETEMIISSLDVVTVVGFAVVGMWLNGIGQKTGYLDAMFTPVPMTAIAVVYDILRGLMQ
jgi:hypothetical protein